MGTQIKAWVSGLEGLLHAPGIKFGWVSNVLTPGCKIQSQVVSLGDGASVT